MMDGGAVYSYVKGINMNKGKNRQRMMLLAALLPFVLLAVSFEVMPVISMILASFQNDDGQLFTLQQYVTSLTNLFYLQAIRNSLYISFFASVVGIIVAILTSYSITRFSDKGRDRILILSNMTSNFAGVPLAFAYIILLGNNGIFTLLFKHLGWDVFSQFHLYSWSGLILVYVYFQIPLGILLLYPTYYGIREQWKEAAALLGANRFQFWMRIGLPILMPGITGTFSILFANAMGAYATAYALVGGNYNLMAIRIGSLVSGDVVTRPQLGSALAVLLGLLMMLSLWINSQMMKRVKATQ